MPQSETGTTFGSARSRNPPLVMQAGSFSHPTSLAGAFEQLPFGSSGCEGDLGRADSHCPEPKKATKDLRRSVVNRRTNSPHRISYLLERGACLSVRISSHPPLVRSDSPSMFATEEEASENPSCPVPCRSRAPRVATGLRTPQRERFTPIAVEPGTQFKPHT